MVNDILKITVVTTGSTKPQTIEIENIAVNVVCGKLSTKITLPTQISRIAQYQYTIEEPTDGVKPVYRSNWKNGAPINIAGEFKSDNPNCPIT